MTNVKNGMIPAQETMCSATTHLVVLSVCVWMDIYGMKVEGTVKVITPSMFYFFTV